MKSAPVKQIAGNRRRVEKLEPDDHVTALAYFGRARDLIEWDYFKFQNMNQLQHFGFIFLNLLSFIFKTDLSDMINELEQMGLCDGIIHISTFNLFRKSLSYISLVCGILVDLDYLWLVTLAQFLLTSNLVNAIEHFSNIKVICI